MFEGVRKIVGNESGRVEADGKKGEERGEKEKSMRKL